MERSEQVGTRHGLNGGHASPKLVWAGEAAWLLLCALLPISGNWITIPLVATVALMAVWAWYFKPAMRPLQFWPLILFYLLHVLGMAWSTDLAFGAFDLQIKLGLVLLPLAAMIGSSVRPGLLDRCMQAFTAGFMVAVLLGVAKATGCYLESGQPNCFSQSTLSFELHPSYTAWYGCWLVAYWGWRLLRGDVRPGGIRLALFTVLPIVVLFTVMLASKSGVLGLAVVLLFLLVLALRRVSRPRRWRVVGVAVALAALAFAMQGDLVMGRMAATRTALTAYAADPGSLATAEDGNSMRLLAWLCSWELIKSDPIGAGTGDIKHALMGCYEAKGAVNAATRRLNCHSQFLQGGVALGWAGLAAILLVAWVPFWRALRRKEVLTGIFMVLFMMNAAVESVLEVQAGVVFFGIFLGFLTQGRSLPDTPRPVHV